MSVVQLLASIADFFTCEKIYRLVKEILLLNLF